MKLVRRLYITAGIIWGVILGIPAGLYIAGGVAGIFWLYIFGDNAWPDWALGAAYTIGILAGILIFGICVFFSWSYCQRLSAIEADQKKEIRKAASLLALSFIIMLGYVVFDDYQIEKHVLLTQKIAEDERRRVEDASPYRKVDEHDIDYYCRIIRKQSKIKIVYKDKTIKIVPESLLSNGQLLFAVAGSYALIKDLAKEILISEEIIAGNKILVSDFVVLPENIRCGQKLFFIRSNTSSIQNSVKEIERVHCSIHSAKVGFTMAIRNEEGTPLNR